MVVGVLDEAIEAIRHGGRHSPLYWALWRDYERLAAEMHDHGTPWGELARIYGEAGVLDKRGQRPSAQVVRKTFRRVANRKAAQRAAEAESHRDQS
jgi:hypothetical protein